MSRDFLVSCANSALAAQAQIILSKAVAEDGERLFSIDNRGHDLFVMLKYPNDLPKGSKIQVENKVFENFDRDVAFVAIKNGQHNGTGYFIDTGVKKGQLPISFPLKDIPELIVNAMASSGD